MATTKRKRSNSITKSDEGSSNASSSTNNDNEKHEEQSVKKRATPKKKARKLTVVNTSQTSQGNSGSESRSRNRDVKRMVSVAKLSPSGSEVKAIVSVASDDKQHHLPQNYDEDVSKNNCESKIQPQGYFKPPDDTNKKNSSSSDMGHQSSGIPFTSPKKNIITPKKLDDMSEVVSVESTKPPNIVHLQPSMDQYRTEEAEEEELQEEEEDNIEHLPTMKRKSYIGYFVLIAFFAAFLTIFSLYLSDKHSIEIKQLGAEFNMKIIKKNMEQNELKSLLNNTQNELESAMNQLKLSEKNEGHCKDNFNSLDKEYNALILKSKALEKQLDDTSMKLDSSTSNEEEVTKILSKAKKEIDSLVAEKNNLLGSNDSCNKSLALISNQNEIAANRILELEASLMTAEEDKQSLKAMHEKEKALRENVEVLLTKTYESVKDLQGNIDTLMAQKNDLLLSFSSCNDTVALLSKDKDDVSKRILELEAILLASNEDKKSMILLNEETAVLREDLEAKLGESQGIVTKLEGRLDEEVRKGNNLKRQIDKLDASIEDLMKEKNELTKSNSQLKGKLDEESKRGKSYEVQIDKLEKLIEALTKEKNELSKSNSSCNNAISSLSSDKETVVKRIADLEASLIGADDDKKTFESLHKKEISLREDAEASLTATQEAMKKLETKLDKEGAKRWYYLLQIKQLQNEIEEKENAIEELKNGNNMLKEEKEILMKQMDDQMRETVSALNAVAKTAAKLKIDELNHGYYAEMEKDAMLSGAVSAVTAVVTAKNDS
jgi:DNA repair exonuclease SbcCD ATPase subunit